MLVMDKRHYAIFFRVSPGVSRLTPCGNIMRYAILRKVLFFSKKFTNGKKWRFDPYPSHTSQKTKDGRKITDDHG